jgi:hypothetical protein
MLRIINGGFVNSTFGLLVQSPEVVLAGSQSPEALSKAWQSYRRYTRHMIEQRNLQQPRSLA